MNLQEWRAKRNKTTPVTLPSGLEVHLKQVDMMDLATQGLIPSGLSSKVQEMLTDGKSLSPTLEDLPSVRTVMVVVAKAAVVEPAELEVDPELDFADLNHIFMWANGGAAQLETFRQEQEALVGAGRDGDEVQPTPE